MSTYLITGGTGFIGANLARRLLEKHPKASIHLITQPGSSLWRLAEIEHKFFVHEIDLINFVNITALIKRIKPTHIFHLAAFGGMPHEQNQTMIFRVNLDATINLLNACKQVGFECFINTGSSSEYGKKNTAMNENDLLEPISDYAVAKAAATQFCFKEAQVNALPIYTVRPFSVYGPYEMASRLIPTIINNALENKPINLGTPHNVRDFIHIDDMVHLYVAIAEQKPSQAFIFNAGTGIQSTVQNVVDTIQKLLNKPLDVTWGSHQARPWEPTCWRADINRAHNVLNWQPTNTLHTGLEKTISWFKDNGSLYMPIFREALTGSSGRTALAESLKP